MDHSRSQVLMQRALLVGIDADWAAEFQSAAAAADAPWNVSIVKGAAEAFQVLERDPIDVVVARVWLTDTNGVDFLDKVLGRWPETARILLTDPSLPETTVRGIGKTHHHLLEPCAPLNLFELVAQTGSFKSKVCNPKLAGLMAKMRQLPSPPETYFQILEEVRADDVSVERIGNLIVEDPALSAKVLQLANSAVFGLHLRVLHPAEAVAYLGVETTKALLLLAHTFSYFESLKDFRLADLQYHALTVGRFAQRIAEMESPCPEVHNEAFTAGLLHDLGKLLLAANVPDEFASVHGQSQHQGQSLWELESQILGANHAQVGGCVLDTWHLAAPIVDAVTWHHSPLRDNATPSAFSPLTAVHAGNVIEHQLREQFGNAFDAQIDEAYLDRIGCSDKWADWKRACENYGGS